MAGSLRYFSSFHKKVFCVTELAEVEDVADIVSIRHDAHLEKQKPKQKLLGEEFRWPSDTPLSLSAKRLCLCCLKREVILSKKPCGHLFKHGICGLLPAQRSGGIFSSGVLKKAFISLESNHPVASPWKVFM